MPAAGAVMIIAVVAIVAAAVFYLVSTIVALRRITAGLDEAIGGVVGIIDLAQQIHEIIGHRLLRDIVVHAAQFAADGTLAGADGAGFFAGLFFVSHGCVPLLRHIGPSHFLVWRGPQKWGLAPDFDLSTPCQFPSQGSNEQISRWFRQARELFGLV